MANTMNYGKHTTAPTGGHAAPPGSSPSSQFPDTPGAGLRPYFAPAVIFRTPLEAVAATCYGAPGKAELTDCIVGNS
jgi:hypothetical protein